jgi:hypothetical protein
MVGAVGAVGHAYLSDDGENPFLPGSADGKATGAIGINIIASNPGGSNAGFYNSTKAFAGVECEQSVNAEYAKSGYTASYSATWFPEATISTNYVLANPPVPNASCFGVFLPLSVGYAGYFKSWTTIWYFTIACEGLYAEGAEMPNPTKFVFSTIEAGGSASGQL